MTPPLPGLCAAEPLHTSIVTFVAEVLFASRLARLSVIDPDGALLGRVDDLVLGPPVAQYAPPLLGIVVAVPGRRIFVSEGRIAAIEPDGIRLLGTALNMRRFAKRASEILVVHDLLDRPVPDSNAVINDVGLVASERRASHWEVGVVDLATGGRLVGRRRRRWSEPWTAISDLFDVTPDAFTHLRELHPHDVAEQLQDLSAAQRLEAARVLDDEQLADLMEELPERVQAELLGELDIERAADVLEAMQPDDAVDLLGELENAKQGELLAAMDPEEAAPLRRLLQYGEHTAGGLMTPEPLRLVPEATVAEALAMVREPEVTPALAGQVFVVDAPLETPTGAFHGLVHVQRLLREPPSTALRGLVDPNINPITPDTDQATVAETLAAYNLLAVPVCDHRNRLLGAVTIDDVLDASLPEGWRSR